MSSLDPSTSLQRTYRYLRIGIAGMVVVIFASIGVAAASVGWLTSLSDYYYSFALLALSGRGLERGLLDAAALFAPLIALIPTTLAPGTVAGVEVPCRFRCFPPAFEADAANGIATYLIAGTVVVIVAALLVVLHQVPVASFAISGGVAIGVLAAYIAFLPQADTLGIPLVLVAEAAALVLFSAFWIVQGIEKWDLANPSLR